MNQSNRCWMDLATELAVDHHPGAVFLRSHLTTIRRSISDNHHSEILFVTQDKTSKNWQGIVGLTTACGCVHVQLMYIRPRFRNTETIQKLFKTIAEAGQKISYGYVMLYCPLIVGLESLHDFCSGLTESHTDETELLPEVIRIYCIPKKAFEEAI